MVSKDEVAVIIRSYLPEADEETVNKLSGHVCRELELALFVLIREAVEPYENRR